MLTIKKRQNLSNLLDELFNENFFNFDSQLPSNYENSFTPLGDVIENENNFQVDLMLPAFEKKDFKLEVKDDTLFIEGERKVNEDLKYNYKQSYFGKFKKSYILPEYVDKDSIEASYENGVLKIIIPKLKDSIKRPKLIEVV